MRKSVREREEGERREIENGRKEREDKEGGVERRNITATETGSVEDERKTGDSKSALVKSLDIV